MNNMGAWYLTDSTFDYRVVIVVTTSKIINALATSRTSNEWGASVITHI